MATINAISIKLYANTLNLALRGNINVEGSTIKCAIITSAKAPTQSDIYFDTIGYTEIIGTNYTAGGYNLDSKTIITSNLTTTFDAADILQAGVIFTGARYLVLYDDTPVSNKPLIAYSVIAEDFNCDGQLSIVWNLNGIFSLVAA